ncbi:MAG: hypothetical protein WA549_04005 [Thermoplasmata archaeon]
MVAPAVGSGGNTHVNQWGVTKGAGADSPLSPTPPPASAPQYLVPINITAGFTRPSPAESIGATIGAQGYIVYTGNQIFQTLDVGSGVQHELDYGWDGVLNGGVSTVSGALIFGNSYPPAGGDPILEVFSPSTGVFENYATSLPAEWQPFGSGATLTSAGYSNGTIGVTELNATGQGNNVTFVTGQVIPTVCSISNLFGAATAPTIAAVTEGLFLVTSSNRTDLVGPIDNSCSSIPVTPIPALANVSLADDSANFPNGAVGSDGTFFLLSAAQKTVYVVDSADPAVLGPHSLPATAEFVVATPDGPVLGLSNSKGFWLSSFDPGSGALTTLSYSVPFDFSAHAPTASAAFTNGGLAVQIFSAAAGLAYFDYPTTETSGVSVPTSSDYDWTPSELVPRLPSGDAGGVAAFGAGLAFNENGSVGALFGGQFRGTMENSTCLMLRAVETWNCWVAGANVPYPAPSPRDNFSFAADPAANTAVLFGGAISPSTPDDDASTWILNLTQVAAGNESGAWTNVTGPIAPAAREGAAFAIDPSQGIGLLAGGWNPDYLGSGPITFQDVWELNLTTYNWTRLPFQLPEAVGGASLAWDPTIDAFALFGGGPIDGGKPTAALFTYRPGATSWSPVTAEGTQPSAREWSDFLYDPVTGRILLFGGDNPDAGDDGMTYGDTWELNFTNGNVAAWERQNATGPRPGFNVPAALAAAPRNDSLLYVGGSGEQEVATNSTWWLSATSSLLVVVQVGAPPPFEPYLSGAAVSIPRVVGITNALGVVVLSAVSSGPVNVSTTVPGYGSASLVVSLPPGLVGEAWFNVTSGATGSGPTTMVLAHVTGISNNNLSGAAVNVTEPFLNFTSTPLTTDAAGQALFLAVPVGNGSGVVTATLSGYQGNSIPITLREGIRAYANLTLFPLTPPSQIELYVNVSIALTNEPLDGANVIVAWGANSVLGITSAQGSVLLTVPFTSLDYSATATLYGYIQNATYFTLSETPVQSVNVSLPLAPLTPLDVHLVDSDTHQSIDEGAVDLEYEAVEVATATSAATGWANLTTNVYPATFLLTGYAAGYDTNVTSVTVAYGLKSVVVEMFLTPTSGQSRGGGGSSSTGSQSAWNLVLLPHTATAVAYFLAVPVVIVLAAFAYLSWMRGRDRDRELASPARAEDSTGRPPTQ